MTSFMRCLDIEMQTGERVWAPSVPADAEWHFGLGSVQGLIDQSGNGHALTAVGVPSWTANGIQFGNGTAGFETDMPEVSSLTRVIVAAIPDSAGVNDHQSRLMGAFQGSSPNRAGSSLVLQTAAVVAGTLPNGSEGFTGFVSLSPTSTASFGTVALGPLSRRTQLRMMALSIDAASGKIIRYMPKFDGSPVELPTAGLATRPLNGNDRIGAWKNAGDAAGNGAYQILHAARWNSALDGAELEAEWRRLKSLYGDV